MTSNLALVAIAVVACVLKHCLQKICAQNFQSIFIFIPLHEFRKIAFVLYICINKLGDEKIAQITPQFCKKNLCPETPVFYVAQNVL